MKRLLYFLAIFAVLALTPSPSQSVILVEIFDNGTDLFMVASGDYDFTTVTRVSTTAFLGSNAAMGPVAAVFGWETGNGTSEFFDASYDGALTGGADLFSATSTTTMNPFHFRQADGVVLINEATVSTGTVNETAVFENTTLASLGMVGGETVTVSWAGNGDGEERGNSGLNVQGIIQTRQTGTIPEPSTALLLGLGMLGAGLIRRKRRS